MAVEQDAPPSPEGPCTPSHVADAVRTVDQGTGRVSAPLGHAPVLTYRDDDDAGLVLSLRVCSGDLPSGVWRVTAGTAPRASHIADGGIVSRGPFGLLSTVVNSRVITRSGVGVAAEVTAEA